MIISKNSSNNPVVRMFNTLPNHNYSSILKKRVDILLNAICPLFNYPNLRPNSIFVFIGGVQRNKIGAMPSQYTYFEVFEPGF